jgi:hypothetical protein
MEVYADFVLIAQVVSFHFENQIQHNVRRRKMKTSLLSLALILFSASLILAACPEGDLNRDCKVDLFDFALMADNWLEVEPNLPFGTVIINEIMSHSHGILPDWIELYNTSGSAINIGGWYLSDGDRDLTKYRIPDGNIIAPYGYKVFYENLHFGVGPNSFGLSENGESLFLSLPRNGVPFVMDDRQFGASEVNVSFGHYTTSIDEVKFVAMDSNTPGQLNSYPKVGPVVISEVMYYFSSADPDLYEYIELYNIKDYPVNLWVYDPCTSSDVNWVITKGVDYTFPRHTTIPAHGYIVVARDKSKYPSVPPSQLFGPFSGKLSNEGENIELSMPGELDSLGARVYVCIDNVTYSDGVHHENFVGLDPWVKTRAANGSGESLHRINPNLFGNDVNNWESSSKTPSY